MRIIFFILLLLVTSVPAYAQMTMQGYCSGVSGCEVLSIRHHPNGRPAGIHHYLGSVEYCRNSEYRLVAFEGQMGGGALRYSFIGMDGEETRFNTPDLLTNSKLCADTNILP